MAVVLKMLAVNIPLEWFMFRFAVYFDMVPCLLNWLIIRCLYEAGFFW